MDIQPRYAAWLTSLGLPVSAAGVSAVGECFGPLRNVEFMLWIAACKRSAPAGVRSLDGIADHDAFTAHCWQVARAQPQGDLFGGLAA
jgi:hypothetical protein